MLRVLLTTTSFQDTPGPHHDRLQAAGLEIVRERGPLPEARMLELAGQFDAFLCGDDAITREVLLRSQPRLRVISKYGIGLDKIDVKTATDLGIPVLFTPGVNHTTVAEHCFLLLLALEKNLLFATDSTRKGEWKRKTGHELLEKTIGIIGMGRIGKEVALRSKAFGMRVLGYDLYWDEAFAQKQEIQRAASLEEVYGSADYLSLHTNLTPETRDLINEVSLAKMKKGVRIINCARGEIVNRAAMLAALNSGQVGGYGTDVLDEEPPAPDHPLPRHPNCLVTPHVGSRTYESVVRQAGAAVTNLLNCLAGQAPLAQANPTVKVQAIHELS